MTLAHLTFGCLPDAMHTHERLKSLRADLGRWTNILCIQQLLPSVISNRPCAQYTSAILVYPGWRARVELGETPS